MSQSYEARNSNMGQEDGDEFDDYFEDLNNDIMPNVNNGQRVGTNAGLMFNDEVDVNDDDFLDIYNMSPRERLMHTFRKNSQKMQSYVSSLRLWQKILIVILGIMVMIMGILLLVFHDAILNKVVVTSNEWKEKMSTHFILIVLIFFVAFPPLIGYSLLSTTTGLIYGVSFEGWVTLAFGSVTGSIASFVVFKTILHSRAEKLVHLNRRFEALASILQENNSYWILALLRLCPFPYSLTNGAIAGVYGISVRNFTVANIITTPKLFIYLFIGSRIKSLAESDSTGSRLFDLMSIVVTLIILTLTAWLLYFKTKKRYLELQNRDRQVSSDRLPDMSFEV
ncbi:tvp38p [Saccharomyces arboricola H-6]|uniref:Golgi apparatus membrane protein TVP38 n=1 Tax=Saccharomyces arboricola (strain H-6 / AS 2.3317 / CBS 10644) TaxID=1160507 RepID=J8Q2G7_SACAR|nr:tvp38p [Saccharomyces arboricola H-6]